MSGRKYESVEIDGVIYFNPAHASELLGISKNTIYKLLKNRPELSFEDAIRLYLDREDGQRISSATGVVYKGVTYSSAFEACLNLDLCYSTIYYRMREHNISFKDAVEFDKYKYAKADNSDVFNLAKYCKEKDLDYRKMYRYTSKGLSLKEAEEKTLHNKLAVEYKGVKYKSLHDACLILDISYQKIYHRIKKGLTFEEAVDMDQKEVDDSGEKN